MNNWLAQDDGVVVIVTSSLVKTLGIDDEVLHIKLATLYDKSGR